VRPIVIHDTKQIPTVVALFQTQTRGLQVRKRAEGSLHQGWFDSLSGMYEDPRYPLDMKPAEFRNGQFYYLFEYLGIVIVLLPCIVAAFMAAFSLAWYTFVDTQVTVLRTNPHPFFGVRNGREGEKTRNPVYWSTYRWAPHRYDVAVLFHNEIEHALKEKKNLH
jgi:hypothetical protein